ncbi:thiol reductant ABC exporter subunit CydC [Oceanobacillus manasiensis]|uniref:thiol reductant ABC exporter subunit CydC n=1 Tax=Oceanobacillus manasiensis TaxID=586413 RepID=UPI0005A6E276|nr:thiol reductant ABC exporter subunit CydC [Oceanobacillus manasiensis]
MKDLAIVTKLMMSEKRDILISILVGFIAGIAGVGLFAASGYLISKAALAPPLYALIVLTSTVKLLGFTRALTRYAERYFSHRATFTILSNLRVSFFEKIEPLAPGIFQKYRSGDLLARIVGDIESLQNFFLRVFYPPIVLALVFLSTIFFTAFFSLYAALVLFLGLILTGFVVPAIFAIKQRKIDQDVRENRSDLSTEVTEYLYGFRDLKIYQQLDTRESQLLSASDKYIQEQEIEGINKLFSQSLNTLVSHVITAIVLGLGVYLIANGSLEGLLLAMLVMISITVFEDASPMAAFPIYYHDNQRAARRLFQVVKQDTNTKKENLASLPETVPSVCMDEVTFSFEDQGRPTLRNVSFELKKGSKTAIVGPSGSGKSTILQLLLKLYEPSRGDIKLNDVPLATSNKESIWNIANVVLQDNHFFFGTIKDNLLLAGDDLTDEQLNEALQKVMLDRFSLSDNVLEKGANLSGGEKQRLAIARALLKKGKLWLLDEPTSSVDALTEKNVHERILEEAENDTLILVSHRLAGMEKMDQILVMDQGQLIESGSYQELMNKKGYFYEMKEIERNLL